LYHASVILLVKKKPQGKNRGQFFRLLKFHHVLNRWMEHLLGDNRAVGDTVVDRQWKVLDLSNKELAHNLSTFSL